MKLPKGVLIFCLFSSVASAMDMHSSQDRTKSFLTASAEFSQFTLEDAAISGSGLKVDFHNAFTDKMALELYLASAINTSGGASFTGIGGYTYYNLIGNCCLTHRLVSIDGKPVVKETSERGQNLQLGLGLDQFFLNGSKSVYSASGLGVSLIYQFSLFKYNFKAEARRSQMSAGQNKIQGSFFSFGVVFPL